MNLIIFGLNFLEILLKKEKRQNARIILFDKIGKPLWRMHWKCLRPINLSYPKIIFLKNQESISLKVVHLMRQEPLLGVKDVGIMVEK